jgi:hypothetical protein
VYHSETRFWTLAMNEGCTVKDVIKSILAMTARSNYQVSIYEAEKKDTQYSSMRKLAGSCILATCRITVAKDTDVMLDIKRKWTEESNFRFFVKKETDPTMFPEDSNTEVTADAPIPRQGKPGEELETFSERPSSDDLSRSSIEKGLASPRYFASSMMAQQKQEKNQFVTSQSDLH